jgi:hypothetical protein
MRSFNNEVSVYRVKFQVASRRWMVYYTASGLYEANTFARLLRSRGYETRLERVA